MQIRDLIPWGRNRPQVPQRSEEVASPVFALQREMNRVFEDFWSRFDRPFGGANGLVGAGPSTDITETDKEVEVAIELPGIDEKDIDVRLTRESLTIRGEKKAGKEEKKTGYYLSERSWGSFYRTIPLPPGIDPDKARAEFSRGVLKITVPKTAEAQSEVKRIAVKAS